MVYVENAADAHLLAADALTPGSPVAGRAYFISQGEPVNCWQWIDEILALAGLPPVAARSRSGGMADRRGLRGGLRRAAAQSGSADDPVPGRPVGQVALLQHRPRPADFGYGPKSRRPRGCGASRQSGRYAGCEGR